MFVDPKTGVASLKQSERDLLVNARYLLEQIAKFTGCLDSKDASVSIGAALAGTEPKGEPKEKSMVEMKATKP